MAKARTVRMVTCPVCKTEQTARGESQKCRGCPATLLYQMNQGERCYYAVTKFTTTKTNPDNDQAQEVHWIQMYPLLNVDSEDMVQDKTQFSVDTTRSDRSIRFAEHTFNGFLSIHRFTNLLQNYLL